MLQINNIFIMLRKKKLRKNIKYLRKNINFLINTRTKKNRSANKKKRATMKVKVYEPVPDWEESQEEEWMTEIEEEVYAFMAGRKMTYDEIRKNWLQCLDHLDTMIKNEKSSTWKRRQTQTKTLHQRIYNSMPIILKNMAKKGILNVEEKEIESEETA
jgi:hypothetical protein